MGGAICFKCLPKSDVENAKRKLKSEKKLLDQINIFFCDNRGVSESFFNFNKVFKKNGMKNIGSFFNKKKRF